MPPMYSLVIPVGDSVSSLHTGHFAPGSRTTGASHHGQEAWTHRPARPTQLPSPDSLCGSRRAAGPCAPSGDQSRLGTHLELRRPQAGGRVPSYFGGTLRGTEGQVYLQSPAAPDPGPKQDTRSQVLTKGSAVLGAGSWFLSQHRFSVMAQGSSEEDIPRSSS